VAGLAALALYARTLAPGLTWAHHGADGGDLLAAALTGGVPHPTGYPTYQLWLRAAIALYPGEPARAGNWLSALAAACAVGLLADLARRVLAAGWPGRPPWHALCALAAALSWAASPLLWSQAVITEVYTLHALAVVLILWLLWRWRDARQTGRRATGWLLAAGLALGLGLGNHLSLALLLPAVGVWVWGPDDRKPRPLRVKTGLTGLEALAGFLYDTPDRLKPRDQGRGGAFTEQQIPNTRPWWALIAGLGLGLSVYIYLPLAAAGDGPVNWGDARTLAGFWWVVSGRPYAELFLGLGPSDLLGRLAAWAQMALGQLGGGPWGLALALIGLWWTDRQQHAWWRATGLIALAYTAYSLVYRTADSYIYLTPVWAVAALWLAAGLGWVVAVAQKSVMLSGLTSQRQPLQDFSEASRKDADSSLVISHPAPCATDPLRVTNEAGVTGARQTVTQGQRLAWLIACAALILLPAGGVLRSWQANDLSRDREARDFTAAALAEAAPDAVILVATDRPTFALWYAIYGLGRRPDVVPLNVNLYYFEWYNASLHRRHLDVFIDAEVCSVSTPVARLVEQLLAERPVYRAEPLDLALPGTRETPAGALVRIWPDR